MTTVTAKRGIIYVVWGLKTQPKLQAQLQRSLTSVKKFHPELPITVHELPDNASLLDKPVMYEQSPYEETIYLDADTEVLERLDFAIEKAVQFHLACVICEAPYARRYLKSITGDTIEYNTGVLFFKKSEVTAPLFARWANLAKSIDSVIHYDMGNRTDFMKLNDQAGFALAVQELGINPFVLPLNWNYRPRWEPSVYGPVKVWHDYDPLPDALKQMWKQQDTPARLKFIKIEWGG